MNKKILGCLLGAAVGDAMGSATETKSPRQIEKVFGGRVTEFRTPPMDTLARGRKAGQITDAFSIPYILTNHLINANGQVSKRLGEEALIEWGDTEYFEPFAGMTTRNVVKRLKQDESMGTWAYAGRLGTKLYKSHYYALSSNGAASKAYPAGLISGGDLDKAVEDAVELTMASHDDPYSISGACAVAAAVSEALKEDTSVFQIVKAAHEGSISGEKLARAREDVWVYPGPSVTKRIEMAVEIAMHSGSAEDVVRELGERIGSGPAIAETVPMALGILVANQGRTMESIYDAVNVGDETSAIACIVGAIAGTFRGADSIPGEYLERIETENALDLRRQAEGIEALWGII